MAWVLLKTGRLPLGARVLDYGTQGADVKELQELLKKAGFYGGVTDGAYGALTREAVLLFQKTFALKADGVAGRRVIAQLQNSSKRAGRIIYTVKTGDSLEKISRKFRVNPSAWKGLFHKGITLKKIYPGMKLLLYEKAVFTWNPAPDSPQNTALHYPLTAQIRSGCRLSPEGNISRDGEDSGARNVYYLLQADPGTWEKVFIHRKLRRKFTAQLSSLNHLNYGFDLRQTNPSTLPYLIDFFKFRDRQNPRSKKVKFLLLPLIAAGSGTHSARATRGYWLNFQLLSRYAGIIMLEPELDYETPLTFMNSALQLKRGLRRLVKIGLSHQCAVVCEAGAWDWDLEDNSCQLISLKKARIIRGMYPQEEAYSPESQYTTINYTHHSRRHCLIYRDERGWEEFFRQMNRYNFFGIVIREFHRLGEKGLHLIANSFAVMEDF